MSRGHDARHAVRAYPMYLAPLKLRAAVTWPTSKALQGRRSVHPNLRNSLIELRNERLVIAVPVNIFSRIRQATVYELSGLFVQRNDLPLWNTRNPLE